MPDNILLVGDGIIDHYSYLEKVKDSEEGDFSVFREVRRSIMLGGAGAVCEMIKGLEGDCTYLNHSTLPTPKKTRFICDGKVLLRIDEEEFSSGFDHAEKSRMLPALESLKDREFDVIAVSDYCKGAVDRHVIQYLRATHPNTNIIVDPAANVHPDEYEGADIVTPNDSEYSRYNWHSFPYVVHKRGAEGMVAYDHLHRRVHFLRAAASPEEVVDVCGAGDMVLAALAVSVANRSSFEDAVRFANVAAGVKCTKRGTSTVSISEIYY